MICLKEVSIKGIRNEENKILGFIGLENNHIEMLFVSPEFSKRGIGRKLLQYSIAHMNANSIEVYEKNKVALDFYMKAGFKIVFRSEIDMVINKKQPLLLLRNIKIME